MKKSYGPLVLMMIFSLGLALSAVGQKTATAQVSETAVFDYEANRFLSSKQGEVENHFTGAVITKRLNRMTFVMKVGADSSYTSVFQITDRKQGSRVILAQRIDTKAKIKIVQKKHSLEVLCDYNEKEDRFDSAIVFTNIDFKD